MSYTVQVGPPSHPTLAGPTSTWQSTNTSETTKDNPHIDATGTYATGDKRAPSRRLTGDALMSRATTATEKDDAKPKETTQPIGSSSNMFANLRREFTSGINISLHPKRVLETASHLWHLVRDYWWLWEIGAIGFSLASMAAAVILLSQVNGMSLADWTFPIQPNSVVSICITLSKSAMLAVLGGIISQSKWMQFEKPTPVMQLERFDEASRGPWGALFLVFDLRKGGLKVINALAVLGAFLTIVAITLDPFAQQIIAYPSRSASRESDPRVAGFNTTQRFLELDGIAFQGSVLGGIYQNPQTVNYECTTSNCQWPTLASLGVCSACKDLTSEVKGECSTVPGPLQPTTNDPWTFDTTSCNYTATGSVNISSYIQTLTLPAANGRLAEYSSEWTGLKLVAFDGYGNDTLKTELGSIILPDEPNTYWFSTVLSYATFFDSTIKSLPKVTPDILAPQVLACGLYPCGQVWSDLSVADGTLAGSNPKTYFPYIVRDITGNDRWYHTFNRSDYSEILQVPAPFPGNGTYQISSSLAHEVTTLLNQILTITSNGGNDVFSSFPEPDAGIYGLTDALFVDRRLDLAFERIAQAVSEYIRNGDTASLSAGSAVVQETYIEVRWLWMVLPLFVPLATCVLLVATILMNWHRGTRIWKSSSLVMLVHELEAGDADDMRTHSVPAMHSAAAKLSVSLGKGRDEFRVMKTR